MKTSISRRTGVLAALFAGVLLAFAAGLAGPAQAGDTQSLYRLGGNYFILREQTVAAQTTITAYRQAGDQWERYAHGTRRGADGTYAGTVGRILSEGQYIGPSSIDLDDWMNTELNRSFPEPF